MNILFIAPYPKTIAPSQRFRFEHYLPGLEQQNIPYSYKTFVGSKDYKVMFEKGRLLRKSWIIAKGICSRIALLFTLPQYNFVYIHREAALLGPPVFEWLAAKVWRKKIIYDFDDAIWIPLSSEANPLASKVKCTWKVAKICKWSTIVTTGNSFLASYAKQFTQDVRVVPTVVNTLEKHNQTKNQQEAPLTIGWTGTFTNLNNLDIVIPAIKKLQQQYQFDFLIIADKDPGIEEIRYQFVKWNKETEIDDLIKLHIGIMPLIKTDVQRGKCAFKAIQYMSLAIPAVVTPIGANCEVVQNGINGFWADTDEEWYTALEKLILNADFRAEMGQVAQKRIQTAYSVTATTAQFLDLFKLPGNK